MKYFLIIIIFFAFSCEKDTSNNEYLINEICNNNFVFSELIKLNLNSNSIISVSQIDSLDQIIHKTINNPDHNLEEYYLYYLALVKNIDTELYKIESAKFGDLKSGSIAQKFSLLSKKKQSQYIALGINKLYINIVKKLDVQNLSLNNDLFLTIQPREYKIYDTDKFTTDIIIAKKMRTINGHLMKGSRIRVKNGQATFSEVYTRTIEDDFVERDLHFEFETKVNGKDSILTLDYKYFRFSSDTIPASATSPR